MSGEKSGTQNARLIGAGIAASEEASPLSLPALTDPASETPFCVVTLIHGTFAPQAEWVKATSTFVSHLTRTVRRPIKPLQFTWSGKNRHHDRMQASEALATHIANVRDTFKGVPHFLVAHSHGGNIVTYCLRHPENRHGIAGVTTLGTPFLTFHPRPIKELGDYLTAVLSFTSCPFIAIGLLVSAGLSFVYVTDAIDWKKNDNLLLPFLALALSALGPVFFLGVVGLVMTPIQIIGRRFGEGASRRQDIALRETELPSDIPVPWHCIRVSGDEAYVGLLLVADWLTQFPFRAFSYLYRVVQTGAAVHLAGGIFSLTLLVVLFGLLEPSSMPPTPLVLVLMGPFTAWCLILGICAMSMPILGGLHRFLYGMSYVDALVVETRVDPLPPSVEEPHAPRFDVRPMAGVLGRWFFAVRFVRGNLLHSLIYRDPNIARVIAHWMRSVLSN